VRDALLILANHLAIALERTELRDRAHDAELLEEVDRLRQSVVGAVSHDLRTPLATIKVASSTLVDADYGLSEAELAELYSLIDQQADRLSRLVNNLLDMTRIQAGVLEVHRRPTRVDALLAEATGGLLSSLGDRPVHFVAQSPTTAVEDLPLADADPVLVSQVLANLIDNANRLAPAGTPIMVEASVAGGTMQLAVVDEGPGVPAAEREAVFETFVRYDTGGRSGLGLAIAKAFIEAHGDRIWVEEAAGGGARFVFSLRAVEAAAAGESAPAGETAAATETAPAGETALATETAPAAPTEDTPARL
jgi:two-component system sensor histidine kinase KdpD